MTKSNTSTHPAVGPAPRRYGGALLIAEGVLAFMPLAILAPAIGWPASLGEPAAVQLTAIAAEADAVRMGYSVYLLYSLLILPAMAVLAHHTLRGPGARAPMSLITTVIGFAGASALARCIGILRWLTVMPLLAAEYATADAAQRPEIERLFSALSEYGGAIGEVLGVSLFMAAAMLALLVPAWRSRSMPRVFSGSGILVALGIAALSLPIFGSPELMPIAVAVTALSMWQIAVGVWLIAVRPAIQSNNA
jgi:hypothetical protein